MRRLPVYILLDTSGSMLGEPILAVQNGIEVMLGNLRQDPHALDTVHIGTISFDLDVKVLDELTPLSEYQTPILDPPKSGPTFLGEALKTVCAKAAAEVRKGTEDNKGDWAPLLFVMTDGKPSDTMVFDEMVGKVRNSGFAAIIGCAAGPKASLEAMKRFCTQTVRLETLDGPAFEQFFKWVSDVIATGSRSVGVGDSDAELPPPPDEIRIAI